MPNITCQKQNNPALFTTAGSVYGICQGFAENWMSTHTMKGNGADNVTIQQHCPDFGNRDRFPFLKIPRLNITHQQAVMK